MIYVRFTDIKRLAENDLGQIATWSFDGLRFNMILINNQLENRNKHTWKIVRQVGYLQGSYHAARSTKLKKKWFQNIILTYGALRDIRLPPRSSWEPRSSEILRGK